MNKKNSRHRLATILPTLSTSNISSGNELSGIGRCIPASETTLQRFAGYVFAPGQSLQGPVCTSPRSLYARIAGVNRRFLNHERKQRRFEVDYRSLSSLFTSTLGKINQRESEYYCFIHLPLPCMRISLIGPDCEFKVTA